MTYVLAWKHQNSVFCISDTAITHSSEPAEPYSSFGEVQKRNITGEVVEEKGVKIVPLTNSFAVSYSGDVSTARKIISKLKIKLSYMNFQNSLIEISKSNPSLIEQPTKLILMGYDNEKGAFLQVWFNKEPGIFHSIDSLISVGSLKPKIKIIIERLLNYMKSGNIDSEHLLQSMLSFMQNLGVHNPLMETNVGGGIFGAGVNSKGFFWHKDITYILYPPDLSKFTIQISDKENIPNNLKEFDFIDIITCLVRDNVWVTSSSITKHLKALMSSESMVLDRQNWFAKWNKKLKEYFSLCKSNYFAFISKKEGIIVLIKNPNSIPSNKYFKIERKGDKKYNFEMRAELIDELMYQTEEVSLGEKHFKFSFKNG
jgi:hypothetical protein